MMLRVLLLLPILLFAISCDGDDPPPPSSDTPSIELAHAPSFLLCNADSLYTFSVRVEGLVAIDSVYCQVTRPDGTEQAPFRLYDDGGVLTLSEPDYAGEHSGDIVPNNYTFTRAIWSNLLCAGEEGVYDFEFYVVGGNEILQTDPVEVEVRSPQACLFSAVEHPTSLGACFEPGTISATLVEDAEIPLDTVRIQWISGDTLWWETDLTRGTGGVWSTELTPNLFGCTPTGLNYTLRYEAYNAFGLSCTREATGLSFENGLPVLSNPQMEDTLYRPTTPGDTDTLQFFIRSDDCEIAGMANTMAVIFEVSRDDTEHFTGSPDFFLRDDGVAPDVAIGDGLASSYLLVPHSTTNLDNIYYFRYYSIDCASEVSTDYLIDSVRIIQPAATISGTNSDFSLSISSFK